MSYAQKGQNSVSVGADEKCQNSVFKVEYSWYGWIMDVCEGREEEDLVMQTTMNMGPVSVFLKVQADGETEAWQRCEYGVGI